MPVLKYDVPQPAVRGLSMPYDRSRCWATVKYGHSSGKTKSLDGVILQAALPRSMAPYRAGHQYFLMAAHQLTEAVVPVLLARLDAAEQPKMAKVAIGAVLQERAKRN